MKDLNDYSLLKHNTFGMDVRAERFIEYVSEEELISILPLLHEHRFLHIGGGSNILFCGNYDGIILHSAIAGISVVAEDETSVSVKVGAGVQWDDFVSCAVEKGWSGAENLSLIPGEVGASAVQNIGAYGVEAKDLIENVETIDLTDGTRRVFLNAECGYGYRKSIFKNELKGRYAVTYVTYRLSKVFQPKIDYGNVREKLLGKELTPENVRNAVIDIRQSKLPDPEVTGNAGSFFMNPVVCLEKYEALKTENPDMPHYIVDGGVKIPAGWLIEKCGWKGKSLGRAGVCPNQALVLINLGGATGRDIVALSNAVCKSVSEKFGISISPEVNII